MLKINAIINNILLDTYILFVDVIINIKIIILGWIVFYYNKIFK